MFAGTCHTGQPHDLQRRLDPERFCHTRGECYHHDHTHGNFETVQIASQPDGRTDLCWKYWTLYSESTARSRSLPNRLFSYLKR